MTADHLTPEQKAEAPLFFGDGSYASTAPIGDDPQ
jgi:hypothetical protein